MTTTQHTSTDAITPAAQITVPKTDAPDSLFDRLRWYWAEIVAWLTFWLTLRARYELHRREQITLSRAMVDKFRNDNVTAGVLRELKRRVEFYESLGGPLAKARIEYNRRVADEARHQQKAVAKTNGIRFCGAQKRTAFGLFSCGLPDGHEAEGSDHEGEMNGQRATWPVEQRPGLKLERTGEQPPPPAEAADHSGNGEPSA